MLGHEGVGASLHGRAQPPLDAVAFGSIANLLGHREADPDDFDVRLGRLKNDAITAGAPAAANRQKLGARFQPAHAAGIPAGHELRRTAACGRGRGGRSGPCGHCGSPCGPENRDGACGPGGSAEMCASLDQTAPGTVPLVSVLREVGGGSLMVAPPAARKVARLIEKHEGEVNAAAAFAVPEIVYSRRSDPIAFKPAHVLVKPRATNRPGPTRCVGAWPHPPAYPTHRPQRVRYPVGMTEPQALVAPFRPVRRCSPLGLYVLIASGAQAGNDFDVHREKLSICLQHWVVANPAAGQLLRLPSSTPWRQRSPFRRPGP